VEKIRVADTRAVSLVKTKRDALKAALSQQLRDAMAERGWNAGRIARETTKHLGGERKISQSHVWNYIHERSLPRPIVLKALAKALGTQAVGSRDVPTQRPVELLVDTAEPNAISSGPMESDLQIRDLGNGFAWVKFSQRMRWDFVVHLIKELHRAELKTEEP
jgi:hypothetical protein